MPLLVVGRNHLFTEDFRNVITPSNQGGRDCVVVRFRNGNEESFQGEEAETLRQWLASQAEASAPATLVTKAEPQTTNKSVSRR